MRRDKPASVRARYRCPDKLAELIMLANSASWEIDYPVEILGILNDFIWSEDWDAKDPSTVEAIVEERLTQLVNLIYKDIQNESLRVEWERKTIDHLSDIDRSIGPHSTLEKAILSLFFFYNENVLPTRWKLIAIANHFQRRRQSGQTENSSFQLRVNSVIRFDGSIARSFTDEEFSSSILNVDCDRIRRCVICNRLFWATRSDSETDSRKCLNTLTQRRYCEKNREEINRIRRENYHYKTKRQGG